MKGNIEACISHKRKVAKETKENKRKGEDKRKVVEETKENKRKCETC